MNPKLLSVAAILLTVSVMQPSHLKAQTLNLNNNTVSTGNWPFTWDNSTANDNDIAWDIEPIDDDNDGIKDNGF
jgi:hypothetical protein